MRSFTAAAIAALESGRYTVRCLVKIETANAGNLCLWDDVGSLTIDGDTYVGKPNRFTVESSVSVSDLTVQNLDIKFAGVDSELIAMIDGVQWHQQPVTVQRAIVPTHEPIGTFSPAGSPTGLLLALTKPESPAVISLVPEFAGFLDQIIWSDTVGATTSVTLRCESASREFSRSGSRTASDADQRERDANDGFFKFVTSAANEPIEWGRETQRSVQQRPRGLAGLLDKIF